MLDTAPGGPDSPDARCRTSADRRASGTPDLMEIFAERAVVFLGSVVVEGWCSAVDLPDELRIGADVAHPLAVLRTTRAVRHDRPDVGLALADLDLDPSFAAFGFSAAFALQAEDVPAVGAGREAAFGSAAAGWASVHDGLRTLGPFGAGDPAGREMIERALRHGLLDNPRVADLLGAVAAEDVAPDLDAVRIERHGTSGVAVAIEFWLPDAAERGVLVANAELSWLVDGDDLLHPARGDVTDHLAATGRAVATDRHGVLAVLPTGDRSPAAVVVGLTDGQGRVVLRAVPLAGPPLPADAMLDRLLAPGLDAGERLGRLVRPLLARDHAGPAREVGRWGASPAAAALSAIVVVTDAGLTLQALLAQMAALPLDGEWIVACADPALADDVRTQIAARARTLAAPVLLVTGSRRAGWAAAANAGASRASAPLLLFMAEGVWLDSLAGVEAAARRIGAGEADAIGFRLLFEDGTLRHDGWSGHPSAREPGRGLPPRAAEDGLAPAEALSHGLLLTRRDLHLQVGGFADCHRGVGLLGADYAERIRAEGGRAAVWRHHAAVAVDMSHAGDAARTRRLDRLSFATAWPAATAASA